MALHSATLAALAAFAVLGGALRAQGVTVSSKKITIHGTSNVHDWSCTATSFTANVAVPPTPPGELGSQATSLEVALPVSALDCGKGQMNTNLRKTMHADRHPTIQYSMESWSSKPAGANAFDVTVRGTLTANGTSRPVTMTGRVTADGSGGARGELSTSLKTTDFGIEPVKALMGTIRTGETVRIVASMKVTASAPTAVSPSGGLSSTGGRDSASLPMMDAPVIRIQYWRPRDQRGLFTFEAPKLDTTSYRGFALQWGAAFTQEFQDLSHENTAVPVVVAGVDQNQLMVIGAGFNNAVANLYVDMQVARGIRVALTSYLSSRHHQETWVKDGYFLLDASPIENKTLDDIMRLVTLKLGHFEVNYGDAHFRRTDNGQAIYNPLVGNLMLDAFTTEIGFEGYVRTGPFLAMAGATGGEIRGQVTAPERRSPAWLGKLGVDYQFSEELRTRLTGSTYGSAKARSNTLYTGDRAGSPYFMVLENTVATETANAWSGNIRPGFANVVHAYMVNPFVRYRFAEFFGTVETATGKASAEPRKRTIRQLAGEGVVRGGPREQFFAAARYNRVAGQLPGIPSDITVNKYEIGGGWFLLPTVLAKIEYVQQRYHDFPGTDIRSGGRFSGIVGAGTVAF